MTQAQDLRDPWTVELNDIQVNINPFTDNENPFETVSNDPANILRVILNHLGTDPVFDDFFEVAVDTNIHNNRLFSYNMVNVHLDMLIAFTNIVHTDEGPEPHDATHDWFEMAYEDYQHIQYLSSPLYNGTHHRLHNLDPERPPNYNDRPIRYFIQPCVDRINPSNDFSLQIIHLVLSHLSDEERAADHWDFRPPPVYISNVNVAEVSQREKDYYALLQTPAVSGPLQMCLNYARTMVQPLFQMITILYHPQFNAYSLIIEVQQGIDKEAIEAHEEEFVLQMIQQHGLIHEDNNW